MTEWSLVLFTLLIQTAVGLTLVGTLLFWRLDQPSASEAAALRVVGRLPLPVAAIGLVVSLFHLGQPLGAFRALSHLGSSWLSREILLTLAFTLAVAVLFYFWQRHPDQRGRLLWSGVIASLIGLGALYSSGMIYYLPTRPEWQHWSTLVSGLVTALLLAGLVTALLMLVAARGSDPSSISLRVWRTLGLAVLLAVALLLIGLTFYGTYLTHAAPATAALLFASPWFWVRLLVGIGLPVAIASPWVRGLATPASLAVIALVAAIGGESIGRALFYGSVLTQLPLF